MNRRGTLKVRVSQRIIASREERNWSDPFNCKKICKRCRS